MSKIPARIIFVLFTATLVFAVIALPVIIEENTVFFGWMSVPVFSGILINIICLVLVVVYTVYYWPYDRGI